MKKLLFILVTVIGLLTTGKAQELKCEVRVNANQVEGSDRTVFQSLQTSLYEFINNTKFTDINFRQNEKIDCSILVNIKTRENNDFTAEVNVALSRPVYKTNYSTPLFNYIDRKVYFEYMEGTTLDFNPTTYISNLTHIIGYYVYLMLGLDFDSFSLYGGEPFFAVVESIVNSAPQDPGSDNGWNTSGRQNRHTIINEITNESYRPLRQFLYEYHRLGLDVMAEKPDQGREAILNSLSYLQAVHERNSMCYFLQLICETKRDEIIQVFSQGSQKEKTMAVNIMKTIDASQGSRYDAILQTPGR